MRRNDYCVEEDTPSTQASTKSMDNKPKLSVLLAIGTAPELNSGIRSLDKEDVHLVGHLRTYKPDGSLFQIQSYHEAWDDHLKRFYGKLCCSLAPSEDQPGTTVDAYDTRLMFKRIQQKFPVLCEALPADEINDTHSPPSSPGSEPRSEEIHEEPPSSRATKGNKHRLFGLLPPPPQSFANM